MVEANDDSARITKKIGSSVSRMRHCYRYINFGESSVSEFKPYLLRDKQAYRKLCL